MLMAENPSTGPMPLADDTLLTPRQGKQPPRACRGCGELRHHAALGLCSPCWQRHPDRPFIRGSNLAARLPQPPDWLGDFIAHLAARHGPARACTMITVLGRPARKAAAVYSALIGVEDDAGHRHRHHQRAVGQLGVVMLAQREPQHPARSHVQHR